MQDLLSVSCASKLRQASQASCGPALPPGCGLKRAVWRKPLHTRARAISIMHRAAKKESSHDSVRHHLAMHWQPADVSSDISTSTCCFSTMLFLHSNCGVRGGIRRKPGPARPNTTLDAHGHDGVRMYVPHRRAIELLM